MTAPGFHPLADLFPLMQGEDFARLVEDVRAHGLRELIVIHDGLILDGRNRWRAAVAAGRMKEADGAYYSKHVINDGFREFGSENEDGDDPLAWVISKNLNRRHLSESQRAMVAARIAKLKPGRPSTEKPSIEGVSAEQAAARLNVGRASVERARAVQERAVPEVVEAVDRGDIAVSAAAEIAALPAEEQKRLIEAADPKVFSRVVKEQRAKRQAEKKARRSEREVELAARQVALPAKKYGVIVADPEWRFEPFSRESGMDRAADNHYPTSDLATLMARDVGAIAADDCVLFLWATVPMLVEAICVADAWGFCWLDRRDGLLVPDKERARYVTHFAWLKHKIITGYWNRGKHEVLLVFTRGKPVAPAMGAQLPSWEEGEGVAAGASEHSRKPEIFLEWIERLWPSTPKIELNARRARPGWDAWGYEVGADDSIASPPVARIRSGGDEAMEPAPATADRAVGTGSSSDEHDPASPVTSSRPDEEAEAAPPPVASTTAGAEPPPSVPADRPSVTKGELAEWKALGAIDSGVSIDGPLFEQLFERGLVWKNKPPQLTVGGGQRLAELDRLVSDASDGDGVNVAEPAEEAEAVGGNAASASLPPAPKEQTSEWTVGGMRKTATASFGVRPDRGRFAIFGCFDVPGLKHGSFGPEGDFDDLAAALHEALAAMEAGLRGVAADGKATAKHRTALGHGLKWIDARRAEWGLA